MTSVERVQKFRGILSLSGGLDSSTLLAEHQNVIEKCVFFYYGSKQNDRELLSAKAIAKYFKKPLHVIKVDEVFKSFKSALLKHSKEEVELGSYDDKEVSNAAVPFRNGIFASMLVGLGESWGCNLILLGVHGGDHRLYPDCTPDFINSLHKAVNTYNKNMLVRAPYSYIDKSEIAEKSLCYDVPISMTYSCYLGGDTECGKCPTCIEKRDALGVYYQPSLSAAELEAYLTQEDN